MAALDQPIHVRDMVSNQIAGFVGALEDALQVGRWSNHTREIQVRVFGHAFDVVTDEAYDFGYYDGEGTGRIVRLRWGDTHEIGVLEFEGDDATLRRVVPATVDRTWERVVFSSVGR